MKMDRTSLQSAYYSKQQEIRLCQNQSRTLEEQLQFVSSKKTELSAIKDDLQTNKTDALLVDHQIHMMEWRGENYGKFHDEYVVDLVRNKYANLLDEVDRNLDALVTEERRLENELLENEGLLGRLRQGLNWISSELEKAFN